MDKPAQNIQDSFLNNARKDKTVITLYLLSGVKLSGRIKSFDKYSLILETNNQEQLIFRTRYLNSGHSESGPCLCGSSPPAHNTAAAAQHAAAETAHSESSET